MSKPNLAKILEAEKQKISELTNNIRQCEFLMGILRKGDAHYYRVQANYAEYQHEYRQRTGHDFNGKPLNPRRN